MLQCALSCYVLQCGAARQKLAQSVAVCDGVLRCITARCNVLLCVILSCYVLQCVAARQKLAQSVAVYHSEMQCITECCSVSQ